MRSRMLAMASLALSLPFAAACSEDRPEDALSREGMLCAALSKTATYNPDCSVYQLEVTKSAETSFVRKYVWTIDKTSSITSLELSPGEVYPSVPYSVTVLPGSVIDSGWAVWGYIDITNPAPVAATITAIDDTFGGSAMTIECATPLPIVLDAQASITCTYSGSLAGPVDGTNTVVVTTSGSVSGAEASADVVFGDPTKIRDECVDVTDSMQGALGQVCVPGATLQYTRDLTAEACSPDGYDVVNVATFTAIDSGATGSDDHVIHVTVPCETDEGCTLTPGYWKTHSDYGPAPYDSTWAQLGPDTPFFSSGKTYYEALWTAPHGNAYYVLAHAYIAAVLNGLAGADTSAVATQLAHAEDLFNQYAPAAIGALGGNSALRADFIATAAILDDYDNGDIGPGHCD
ncbi:MAG TPA: hypothetical protein VL400_08075 [Polyangiaceae bacterium]|nr:hypothetical protein [Polyangiaceae bacterium]